MCILNGGVYTQYASEIQEHLLSLVNPTPIDKRTSVNQAGNYIFASGSYRKHILRLLVKADRDMFQSRRVQTRALTCGLEFPL